MKKITTFTLVLLGTFSMAHAASAIDKYPTVFVGKDKWVIAKEEFVLAMNSRNLKEADKRLDQVQTIVEGLESKGIKVIIALSPGRMNVYPRQMPDDLFAEYKAGTPSYDLLINDLQKRKLNVVNLKKAIQASKYYNSDLKAYFRLEPHWNTYGAITAARAVSDQVWRVINRASVPVVKYSFSMSQPQQRAEGFWRNGLPKDVQTTIPLDKEVPFKLEKLTKDSGSALLDSTVPKIVLTGTSFTGYGFRHALTANLQADILDVSVGGQGIWTPFANYLKSNNFKQAPPKLIVWEIPEYILATYPMPTKEESVIFDALKSTN